MDAGSGTTVLPNSYVCTGTKSEAGATRPPSNRTTAAIAVMISFLSGLLCTGLRYLPSQVVTGMAACSHVAFPGRFWRD